MTRPSPAPLRGGAPSHPELQGRDPLEILNTGPSPPAPAPQACSSHLGCSCHLSHPAGSFTWPTPMLASELNAEPSASRNSPDSVLSSQLGCPPGQASLVTIGVSVHPSIKTMTSPRAFGGRGGRSNRQNHSPRPKVKASHIMGHIHWTCGEQKSTSQLCRYLTLRSTHCAV